MRDSDLPFLVLLFQACLGNRRLCNRLLLLLQWGAAYRLDGTPDEQQETLKYLEWREKQYDLRYRSDVFGKESNGRPLVEGALIYIATPDR